MNRESLINDFVIHEKTRGMRSLKKLPYELGPFFTYLDEGGKQLSDIGYRVAQDYQTYLITLENEDHELHYSSSAVYNMMHTVKCFYDYLKFKKLVYTNPFYGVRMIRVKKKLPRDIPGEKELDSFLEMFRRFWQGKHLWHRRNLYKIHVITELMYSTGMRLSEVADLEERDIDFEGKMVNIRQGKGGKARNACLNDYAAAVLHLYVTEMRQYINRDKKSRKVFGVNSGKSLEKVLNGWLKRVGRKCGLKRFTSHSFRHALGFHLLRRGCGIRFIQLILGHENLKDTSVYTKVEKADLRNELDKHHPRQFKRIKECKDE